MKLKVITGIKVAIIFILYILIYDKIMLFRGALNYGHEPIHSYTYPYSLFNVSKANETFIFKDAFKFDFDYAFTFNSDHNYNSNEIAQILTNDLKSVIASKTTGIQYNLGRAEYTYTKICFFKNGELIKVYQLPSDEIDIPQIILPDDIIHLAIADYYVPKYIFNIESGDTNE